MKNLQSIFDYLARLIVIGNRKTPAGEHFYNMAKWHIKQDVAPTQNEYGCAEAVNYVCIKAFNDVVGGDISSYRMYLTLRNNKKFIKVNSPRRGDIIISPTGFARKRTVIKNGHVGIVSDNGKIMSNDSDTGLWLEKYSLWSWKQRYGTVGRYPVLYFRRLTF